MQQQNEAPITRKDKVLTVLGFTAMATGVAGPTVQWGWGAGLMATCVVSAVLFLMIALSN